jgi:8-oxo-dGTP diphosphatase
MHQPAGEFAIVGEQQQAAGVDVQPADRDPAPAGSRRQMIEYRVPTLRVLARGHLALRLVVDEDLRRLRLPQAQRLAVQTDLLLAAHTHAEYGRPAVDGEPAFADPALDLTT